jgi:Amt family ammonium transporter
LKFILNVGIFFFCFSGIAALALVNTIAAAAAGLITFAIMDAIRGHVTVSGACVGVVVGLVAITPACGFVQPGWSILFGVIPTFVIYFLLMFKHYLRFDDTLDCAIVHGCGMFPLKMIIVY